MSEECECPPCEDGLPAWLATFADLMTLLMCFFVLMLSFAELDALKFRQVAAGMKNAFGVQRTIEAIEIPKGTSVIAKKYSPGKPIKVTPLEMMREKTTDDSKINLDFSDTSSKNNMSLGDTNAVDIVKAKAEEEANKLQEKLSGAIGDGLLDVEAFADRVLIRIREKGSFGSGQAKLKEDFFPILQLIADVLTESDGLFIIYGHTDDIPIKTNQFRSNWELSASRAASVVHYFIQQGGIDPERLEIRALADNQPIVPNDSWYHRSQNRRIEINVLHGNNLSIAPEASADNINFINDSVLEN
ncbi:MAG: chemotaxis protein MotB [Candidatus Azotimanducaceae bacterium]|jgi:chemotaxis protein MotB